MTTLTLTVPRHPGKRPQILVRDAEWVAKGYQAVAWFQAVSGKRLVGRITLSRVDLNLAAYECCHAAWHLAGPGADEERICQVTGELTQHVWSKLGKIYDSI